MVEAFSSVQGLGVGQAGEAVDGGVQVGVAGSGSFVPLEALASGAGASVGPPAASRWDASDLLDVQVDYAARGSGPGWVCWPGWSARWCRVSRRQFRLALSSQRVTGAHRHHCPALGELVADTGGGPLRVRRQCSMRSTVLELVQVGR